MLYSRVQLCSDADLMERGRQAMEQVVAICCASGGPNDMRLQRHSLAELSYGCM